MSLHALVARTLAAGLVLSFAATAAAPPAFAAGPAPGPIARSASARVAAVPVAALRLAQADTGTTSSKPFLKSRRGMVATALLAGVLGWTVYSFSDDRVKSPAK